MKTLCVQPNLPNHIQYLQNDLWAWNERFSSTNELLMIPLFFLWSIWPPGGRLLHIGYGPWNNTGIKSMCDQKWGDWNLVKFGEAWLLFGKWRLGFWVSHQLLSKAVSGDIKLSGRFCKLWVLVKWKALAVAVLSFCQVLWYACCFWGCWGRRWRWS